MEFYRRKKFYCAKCGKWLGRCSAQANTEGIFPYCSFCGENVEVTTEKPEAEKKKKYECQSAYK